MGVGSIIGRWFIMVLRQKRLSAGADRTTTGGVLTKWVVTSLLVAALAEPGPRSSSVGAIIMMQKSVSTRAGRLLSI
jgi:hypothetical protein